MGSVRKHPNGRWRARVRLPDRRIIERHFPRKVDADKWVAIQSAKLATGEWLDPRSGRLTVEQYGESWRAGLVHRSSTATAYEIHLRRHLYPVLGKVQLGALRSSQVQAWVRGLSEHLAPATVETTARVFGSMLRAAVADRIISASPMAGVRIVAPERALVRPLDPEQVAALMDALPPHLRALAALGAGCGLRISEAMGLTVDRVDWLRRRVRVDRQLVHVDGTYHHGPPKTRTSTREVALPQPVALELAHHLEQYPAREHEGLGRLIFATTRQGRRPLHRSRVAAQFMAAATRAGVPGATFHDLRHHYASLLIGSGVSVKAVQTALGHATAAETLDTYGHLWPAEEDALSSAIERAWNAKSPPAAVAVEGLGELG